MDVNQTLDDSETAMRYALESKQAQMWTAMPAIVTKVNLTQMTLECQPAIKGIQSNEDGSSSYVNLPQLVDVPICFPSAGGFTLTLPIAIGDEILAIIANRCIDAWWQLGGVQVPMELRMHDLSDGFAIPGPRSLPMVIPSISSVNAQLRSNDGTTYLEITPTGKINLVAPSGIGITGALTVTGAITATGEVTANFGTGVPVPLSTHVHPGVMSGTSDTGAPL
jgi:protein gp138/GpV-like protein with Apex motif